MLPFFRLRGGVDTQQVVLLTSSLVALFPFEADTRGQALEKDYYA